MPNARRLLVVDDDQDLRDTLTEQLALYDEFEILSADTAASAINQAKADRIDLAIVDVALPDMDGREAVKIMRRNGFRSPIIMLTGQASEADTVLGLRPAPTITWSSHSSSQSSSPAFERSFGNMRQARMLCSRLPPTPSAPARSSSSARRVRS